MEKGGFSPCGIGDGIDCNRLSYDAGIGLQTVCRNVVWDLFHVVHLGRGYVSVLRQNDGWIRLCYHLIVGILYVGGQVDENGFFWNP